MPFLFLWPKRAGKREALRREAVTKHMQKSGYGLRKNGLSGCLTCGSYCGQCGDDRSGLTMEEWQKQYMKDEHT